VQELTYAPIDKRQATELAELAADIVLALVAPFAAL
jgi:hypothetical protein